MAEINYIIPEQNFEKIRDSIVTILQTELSNQFTLTSLPIFNVNIFKERFIAFDKTELPAIRVYFDRMSFVSRDPEYVRTEVNYNIEVHTMAKSTLTDRGDTLASLACEKLLGVIRYILAGPFYLRLGFENDRNIILKKEVENLSMAMPSEHDGIQSVAGVLTLKITSQEYNGALASTTLEGADSDVGITKLTVEN